MADCAVREVAEETGLHITSLGPPCAAVDVIEPSADGSGGYDFHYCVVDFVAFAEGVPCNGDDALDARWVPVADVASHVETHEGVQAAIDQALAMIDAGLVTWPKSVRGAVADAEEGKRNE